MKFNVVNYVNMKKFALAVLSLAGLPYVASPQVMPRLAKEGVELHIGLEFNHSWSDDVFESDSAGLYVLPAGCTYPVAEESPLMVDGGVTYHDGKIYVNSFDDGLSAAPEWRIYDLATGKLEKAVQGTGMQEDCTNAITYDISTDVIYGVLQNNNGIYLAKIDPGTGEKTTIGLLSENGRRVYRCYSLAADRYGDLYTVYEPNGEDVGKLRLARVNPNTGDMAPINGTGDITCTGLVNDETLVAMGNRHALVFNNQSGKLYWLRPGSSLYVGDYYTPIFELDVNTAVATMVGYLPCGTRITGAFFDEPVFTAPDAVSALSYEYSATSADRRTGKLTVTAPSTTYDGKPIEGKLKIVITEGDLEIVLDNVEPGSVASTDEREFAYGEHTFTCKVVNAEGTESPARTFDVFVGYDLPYAPANLKLENDGRRITLTWDAPTEGIHGWDIDKSKLTYRIVRYSYVTPEVVEEDFTGTTFVEEVQPELTRYMYMVCSKYDGHDGYAMYSNAVVAGDPVSLPYECAFDDEAEFYNQYKVVDSNGDNCTWVYDLYGGTACYAYSEVNEADDWLFTPPAVYEAGHTYQLALTVQSGGADVLDNLAVCFGGDDEPQSQELLEDYIGIPAKPTVYKVSVVPSETGVHFFGLHVHSPKFGYPFRLSSLSITDVTSSGVGKVETGHGVAVSVAVGNICIDNPGGSAVSVYTEGGGKVAETSAVSASVPVAPGLYVVKSGADVKKVVVR